MKATSLRGQNGPNPATMREHDPEHDHDGEAVQAAVAVVQGKPALAKSGRTHWLAAGITGDRRVDGRPLAQLPPSWPGVPDDPQPRKKNVEAIGLLVPRLLLNEEIR